MSEELSSVLNSLMDDLLLASGHVHKMLLASSHFAFMCSILRLVLCVILLLFVSCYVCAMPMVTCQGWLGGEAVRALDF